MGGGHRLEGTPAGQGATPSLAGSVTDGQLGRGEAFQGRQELPLGSMEKHLMGLGSGSSCSPTQEEEVNGVGRAVGVSRAVKRRLLYPMLLVCKPDT